MRAVNRMAFKEWAAVCLALADGLQSLIVRKGGIQEGSQGFQAEHDEFWLFPTYEHQQAESLIPSARPLLDRCQRDRPPESVLPIGQYVVVQDVIAIRDPLVLPTMAGLHIWSDRTIDQRFHYKRPGLTALIVRVFTRTVPIELPNSPHFAGCRSWVELPVELSTAGLVPALDDEAFARQRAAIEVATSPIRLA